MCPICSMLFARLEGRGARTHSAPCMAVKLASASRGQPSALVSRCRAGESAHAGFRSASSSAPLTCITRRCCSSSCRQGARRSLPRAGLQSDHHERSPMGIKERIGLGWEHGNFICTWAINSISTVSCGLLLRIETAAQELSLADAHRGNGMEFEAAERWSGKLFNALVGVMKDEVWMAVGGGGSVGHGIGGASTRSTAHPRCPRRRRTSGGLYCRARRRATGS